MIWLLSAVVVLVCWLGYRVWVRWSAWPDAHRPLHELRTWQICLLTPTGQLESRRTVRLHTLPTTIARSHGKQAPTVYVLARSRGRRAYYQQQG